MAVHPVLSELSRRRRGGEPRGRLVLAVAGGGMRGVCTGGMLAGLEDLGIHPSCFDTVYGVSAGAVGAAYYLAGAATEGVTVYWDHLPRLGFVSARRALRGGPAMDLDVLFGPVLHDEVPLDAGAVVGTGRLRVLASSPAEVGTVVLRPRDDGALFAQLRASCHVPLLAGRAPLVDGQVLFDGSLTEPVPWVSPLADGATHVLVLSSTRPEEARTAQSVPEWLVSRAYDLRYRGVHRVIAGQVRTSRAARADLVRRTVGHGGPPFVLEVVPGRGELPGPLCTDAGRLREAGDAARRRVAEVLGPGLDGT